MLVTRPLMALSLCVSIGVSGCATARTGTPPQAAPEVTHTVDTTLMAAYVRQLPPGSRVRATLVDGRRLRGTLMGVTADHVALLPRTRIPEPPMDIPLDTLAALELEPASNVARTIAIGAASGVAAALGVLAILAAVLADD